MVKLKKEEIYYKNYSLIRVYKLFMKILNAKITIVVILVFLLNILAYSKISAQTFDQPSNSAFSNARTGTLGSDESIYIKNPYDIDIMKTKSSKWGAYNLYTSGNYDTVGAAYYTTGSWFWKKYHLIKYDDDSGEGLNFRIEADFNAGDDIFLATRLYNNQPSTYTYTMEENKEFVPSEFGGSWKQDKKYMFEMQTEPIIKTFYPKTQVALLHSSLEDQMFAEIETLSKKGNIKTILDHLDKNLGLGLGIATSIITEAFAPGASFAAKTFVSFVSSFVHSAIWSSIPSGKERVVALAKARKKIFDLAGATKTIENFSTVYRYNFGIYQTQTSSLNPRWWSYALLPLGILGTVISGNGSGLFIRIEDKITLYDRAYSNYVSGISLQRGTVKLNGKN